MILLSYELALSVHRGLIPNWANCACAARLRVGTQSGPRMRSFHTSGTTVSYFAAHKIILNDLFRSDD